MVQLMKFGIGVNALRVCILGSVLRVSYSFDVYLKRVACKLNSETAKQLNN